MATITEGEIYTPKLATIGGMRMYVVDVEPSPAYVASDLYPKGISNVLGAFLTSNTDVVGGVRGYLGADTFAACKASDDSIKISITDTYRCSVLLFGK